MLSKNNDLPPGLLGELRKVIGRMPLTFQEAQSAYWSVPDERLSESELESIRKAVLYRDTHSTLSINSAKTGGRIPTKSKTRGPLRRAFRFEQLDERIFPTAVGALGNLETHAYHETEGFPPAEVEACNSHPALHTSNAIDVKPSSTGIWIKVLDVNAVEAVFGIDSLAC